MNKKFSEHDIELSYLSNIFINIEDNQLNISFIFINAKILLKNDDLIKFIFV